MPITSGYSRSVSIYAGDPINPPNIFTIESGHRPFIGGLSLEALLGNRFSLESNVLHRSLWANITTTFNPGTRTATTTTREFIGSTTWEFPILLKYTMGTSRWRPFIDGGISFRSLEGTPAPGPSRRGLTGGAGMALDIGRFQLAPQLRFTRWAQAESNGFYDAKRDQLEFLTTISYRTPTAMHVGGRQLAVGILGGLRLNETLAGAPARLSKRAFGGLSVDVNLSGGLSIETDGIYKPIGITGYSVLTWEFPVMLKYRWNVGRDLGLFAEAGPSFRASGNLQSSIPPSTFGFTAGASIEKRLAHIGVAPALRYTRWGEGRVFRGSTSNVVYEPNSVELVLGMSF